MVDSILIYDSIVVLYSKSQNTVLLEKRILLPRGFRSSSCSQTLADQTALGGTPLSASRRSRRVGALGGSSNIGESALVFEYRWVSSGLRIISVSQLCSSNIGASAHRESVSRSVLWTWSSRQAFKVSIFEVHVAGSESSRGWINFRNFQFPKNFQFSRNFSLKK